MSSKRIWERSIAVLQISDLTAGYGKSEVLRGISLDVKSGEVVTIIGANGAGKSTTLKTLCGVVPATSGRIRFEGVDITNKSPHEIVDLGITMIPEGRQLFPFLSVRDNLLMGAYKRSARKTIQQRLEQMLEIFPRVRERLSQYAGSLSGGEQQMVAIARGMMASPKLLIFDEPSLGLSPLLVEQMFDVIRTVVSQGITVLIVEQNVFHTLSLADRGYVLEDGRIALSGSGAELLDSPHVRRAYLGH
jgi:branched-chain amino acid transport system ATP-binding protein